ncbi:MAG: nucleotide exchange factor GrpE [Candidatus Kapaibacterium sp.]|nr:MAG: nucleotide exchange factor GrpE [Candidatus Kapabacteria bacterium]
MAQEISGTEETASAQTAGNELPLNEELAKLRMEREEFREISLRKVAELENFRRRTEQERQELIIHANFKLLQKLLPMLDDLQRAVESGKSSSDSKAFMEGVELVLNKTTQTFVEIGVTPIEALGQDFDTSLHEALMQMPSEAPEGQILQEAQRGYMLGNKVLRHARVIVSAGMPSQE